MNPIEVRSMILDTTTDRQTVLDALGETGLSEPIAPLSHWGPYVSMAPIHVAAEVGRFDLVQALVSKGANLKEIFLAEGDSILNIVFRYVPREIEERAKGENTTAAGIASAARLAGAPMGFAFEMGRARSSDPTPGFQTMEEFDAACAQFITWAVENGVNPNIGSRNGVVPLELAVMFGCQQAVIALVAGGANPNYISQNGSSILGTAIGKPQILDHLLRNGLDPLAPIDFNLIVSFDDEWTEYNRNCARRYLGTEPSSTLLGRLHYPKSIASVAEHFLNIFPAETLAPSQRTSLTRVLDDAVLASESDPKTNSRLVSLRNRL